MRFLRLVFVIALLFYSLGLSFIFFGSVHSFAEMDWDDDGHVSVGEIIYSLDVGKRMVQEEQQFCLDYFHFKDGATLKRHCWPLSE